MSGINTHACAPCLAIGSSFLRNRARRYGAWLLCAWLLSIGMARDLSSLPACDYQDRLTYLRAYQDWPYTLLDTLYRLPADYSPPDLRLVSEAGFAGNHRVRALVLDDLRALGEAARAAGNPLAIQSAYRSYSYQQNTFAYWVNLQGRQAALRVSARAGHSEHQLGTAVDFRSEGGAAAWDMADWAQTPAGAWLRDNGWRYGFIMSYPRDSFTTVCYSYEPWHYRYVGREVAAQVEASGLTLREWLWLQQP